MYEKINKNNKISSRLFFATVKKNDKIKCILLFLYYLLTTKKSFKMTSQLHEMLTVMNLLNIPINMEEIHNWTLDEFSNRLIQYNQTVYEMNKKMIHDKIDELEQEIESIIDNPEECFARLIEFHQRSGQLIQFIYATARSYRIMYETRNRVNEIFSVYQDSALRAGTWQEAEEIERMILV
jgi:hypothetical protein